MSRLIDVSGVNPATGKLWFGTREFIWNGVRVEMRWVNHQLKESPPTNGKATALHWTADRRTVVYNDYMVTAVANEKGEAFLVKAIDWDERQAHLWKRNSIVDGWAIAADPTVNGRQPLKTQVDLIAQWNAEYMAWKRIDPRATIVVPDMACNASATEAWFTGGEHAAPTLGHHAGWAATDGYGAHRWDCNSKLPGMKITLFEYYKQQTLKMYDELKAGTRQFEFKEALK